MTQDSARVTPDSLSGVGLAHGARSVDAGLVLVFVDDDVALGEGPPLGGIAAAAAYSFWNASSRP